MEGMESMVSNDLDKELGEAIHRELGPRPALFKPTPTAVEERETSRSAVEQLSLAVAGLLKMEADLGQLTEELVGPYKEEARELANHAEGLPMFDRVRGDAHALA